MGALPHRERSPYFGCGARALAEVDETTIAASYNWVIEAFSRTVPAGPVPPGVEELTPRETEVLRLLAKGLTTLRSRPSPW